MPAPARSPRASRRRRRVRRLLLVYLLLCALSFAVRHLRAPPAPGHPHVELQAYADGRRAARRGVQLTWSELAAEGSPSGREAVLLLHGSPGHGAHMAELGHALAHERRVLLPDLPGFGASSRDLPDYSARAHADYLRQFLDALSLPRVHVVGYSLGGAVALELAQAAPERVRSLTLLSSVGVQELELLGDYHLNHALHGLQLGFLWLLREGTPHFGWLDDAFLSVPYARNFFDTDQRSLRAALQRWDGPTLVLHGATDPLAPLGAAEESARLVAQSELVVLDGGHLLPFQRPGDLAAPIDDFLRRVELGEAATRATADPVRVEASRASFDAAAMPPLSGIGLALFLVLVAAATLVSEDLTCVAVGALVAQGRVGFWPGAAACFAGIYVGDLLLFLAGRWLGRRALRRRPLSWLLDEERVARSSAWFEAKGPAVILTSRFLPGARLPTYFAAGLLHTRVLRFALWFALAAGLWTPLLVWLSSLVGGELAQRVGLFRRNLLFGLLATLALVLLIVRVLVPLCHHRGRRLLLSRWRRLRHWEFWPPWAFYPPVLLVALRAALRHRSLFAFTAANPGIPLGGVIGESKRAILQALAPAGERLPRTGFVPAAFTAEERALAVRRFRDEHALDLPLVVKPDAGQRGTDVTVARSEEALLHAVRAARTDMLIQEYVPGVEFGVFYARRPSEERGRVLSLVEKRLLSVVGDGVRTVERLILDDERAVCMARFFLSAHARRLAEVPPAGERYQLGELGTHCRGALFLDARELVTPALEAAVDEVSRCFPGFYFGRFDVRTESPAALAQGRFRILELNGVTSEAAHVYDPRHSVWTGWRTIGAQWRLAYAIGAENAARGARVATASELLAAVRSYRRLRRLGGGAAAREAGRAPAWSPDPGPGRAT